MKQQEEGDLNAGKPDYEGLDEGAIAVLKGEAPEEEEEFSYGEKVAKRIGKEVKKTKTAQTEARVLREENSKQAAMIAKMQKDAVANRQTQIESDLETIGAEAKTAFEDGETDDYIAAQDKLLDRKIQLAEAKREAAQFNDESVQEPAAAQGGKAPEAQAWIDRNAAWFHKDLTKTANAQRIAQTLQNQGYDTNDPGLYEEIDRQMKPRSQPPPDNSAGLINDPGSHIPNGDGASRVTLDRFDIAMMKDNLGMDPTNPVHREAFLREKRSAARGA